MNKIYIFNGSNSLFPNAVFTDLNKAKKWINENKLNGILNTYPINLSVYDWAINNNYFVPTKEYHFESKFIETFSSANLEHFHFEEGEICE